MAIDLGGQVKSLFSSGGGGFSNLWNYLGYGILALVIAVVVIFFLKGYLTKKKFNKTITFFKRNPMTNKLIADRTIKAMTVRLDDAGTLGYRFQTSYETKNLIPKLVIEQKPNLHYVEYCSDGRIVEIEGFGDYDDQRREYKTRFSDSNTELGRSSLHQMNKERYEKSNFWKENATLLVNIGAIVIIMVFLWLIADKLISLVGQLGSLLDKAGILQDAQSNILNSLNSLLSKQQLNNVATTVVSNLTV